MMKNFKGKAIYNPSGKAMEYSYWACNFFNGCSNDCAYCYLKRGVLSRVWSSTPKLQSCFRDETHALEIFSRELHKNKAELQKNGLFFTFTSDPFLPETVELTTKAILTSIINEVPVKVLTKRADFFGEYSVFVKLCREHGIVKRDMKRIAFGFTLTGNDELEPGASSNQERIEAMRKLNETGFNTFASIEPIITFERSADMIERTWDVCHLYKIGLESGRKYDKQECRNFIEHFNQMSSRKGFKVYWKDSIIKQAGYDRETLMLTNKNCVDRNYNLFKQ